MRATALSENKDLDRRLADLEQAAALERDDPDIYVLRGQVRFARGEYDAAVVDSHRAIRLNPTEGTAYQLRGIARYRKKDYDGAIADLSRSIQLRPQSADGYVDRGAVWFETGDYTKAILDLTTAIRLDPENATAYGNRGLAWQYKGKTDSAIADYDRAIRLNPKDANTYGLRAYAWMYLGKLDAALADCETAIRLDPACVTAYLSRGTVWLGRGKPDAALADFNEAIRRDPAGSQAYLTRGQFWWGRGKLDAALADFERTIRLDPRNATAYLGRASVRELRKDYAGALADDAAAARLDPSMPIAHNNAAWILRHVPGCPVPGRQEGRRGGDAGLRADALADRDAARYAGGGVCRVGRFRRGPEVAIPGHCPLPHGPGEDRGRGPARALQGPDSVPSAGSLRVGLGSCGGRLVGCSVSTECGKTPEIGAHRAPYTDLRIQTLSRSEHRSMPWRELVERGAVRGASIGAILIAVGLMLGLAMPAPARAQAPAGADWVGKRVVQKDRKFALRDDTQAVIWSGRQIHVYRVERVDGARLRLRAEGNKDGHPSGWAAADQVVPIDQAVAFFTGRIAANPEDGFSCLLRAAIKAGADRPAARPLRPRPLRR